MRRLSRISASIDVIASIISASMLFATTPRRSSANCYSRHRDGTGRVELTIDDGVFSNVLAMRRYGAIRARGDSRCRN